MINEAFLIAALAIPVSSFPHTINKGDLAVFHMLAAYKDQTQIVHDDQPRILLINGYSAWIEILRKEFSRSWRITSKKTTPYDIVGYYNQLPIKSFSMDVVIDGLPGFREQWLAQHYLEEAIRPLKVFGIFLFDAERQGHFEWFLPRWGFVRLPIRWHQFLIYQRLNPGGSHGINDIEGKRHRYRDVEWSA